MLRVYEQRVTNVLVDVLMALPRHLLTSFFFLVWVFFACFAACVCADEV